MSILGVLLLFILNKIFFDVFINQSIIAKQVAYKLSYSLIDVYSRVLNNLNLTFVPITFSFTMNTIFTLFFFAIFAYSARKISETTKDNVLVFFIGATSIVLPTIYGIKTLTFPWYLYPATFMIYVSISYGLIQIKHVYTNKIIIIILLGPLFLSELLFLKNISMKESYRADIGIYIKSITEKDATIFLEPIGYIPYFSQRYVYCEVGLVTPEVTEYRRKHSNYHKYFIKDKKPTIIVSRGNLFSINNSWGIDPQWQKDNYILKKHFVYKKRNIDNLNSFEKLIFNLGAMSDFYVYKKIYD